jgi:hypothetical protein
MKVHVHRPAVHGQRKLSVRHGGCLNRSRRRVKRGRTAFGLLCGLIEA